MRAVMAHQLVLRNVKNKIEENKKTRIRGVDADTVTRYLVKASPFVDVQRFNSFTSMTILFQVWRRSNLDTAAFSHGKVFSLKIGGPA